MEVAAMQGNTRQGIEIDDSLAFLNHIFEVTKANTLGQSSIVLEVSAQDYNDHQAIYDSLTRHIPGTTRGIVAITS